MRTESVKHRAFLSEKEVEEGVVLLVVDLLHFVPAAPTEFLADVDVRVCCCASKSKRVEICYAIRLTRTD